jgi:sulfite reductase alpha subunit-like flavoprotein
MVSGTEKIQHKNSLSTHIILFLVRLFVFLLLFPARPRIAPAHSKELTVLGGIPETVSLSTQSLSCSECSSERISVRIKNKVYITYGTHNGSTYRAAKRIEIMLEEFMAKKFSDDVGKKPKLTLLAGNAMSPERLVKKIASCRLAIFVTCTYNDGNFPNMLQRFWKHIDGACTAKTFESMKYAVFGLGSSMYSGGIDEFFNGAAKKLDTKLDKLGGERIIPVGMADDLDCNPGYDRMEWYCGELDPWMDKLLVRSFDND